MTILEKNCQDLNFKMKFPPTLKKIFNIIGIKIKINGQFN